MLAKCSNPECESPFDYREGQLVRFLKGQPRVNRPLIEHFWLCGKCSELFVLKQESGDIRLKPRADSLRGSLESTLVLIVPANKPTLEREEEHENKKFPWQA